MVEWCEKDRWCVQLGVMGGDTHLSSQSRQATVVLVHVASLAYVLYTFNTTSLLFFTVLKAYPALESGRGCVLFIIPLGFYSIQKLSRYIYTAYTGSCSYFKRTNAPLTWWKVASVLHNAAAITPVHCVYSLIGMIMIFTIISLFAFLLHGWLSWKLSMLMHNVWLWPKVVILCTLL